MPTYDRTVAFYLADHPRTLFPMETNRFLVNGYASDLGSFVYQRITHDRDGEIPFLPQTRAYAAKPHFHLRRTAKLDPVAEFFLYDLVYRNRAGFGKSGTRRRRSFGYRFSGGQPQSPMQSFREFREAVKSALGTYKYCAKFDVSSYFNSIYHHDLVAWFNNIAKSEEDAAFFDKYLKQTNSGRSIDCLPHGLYPAKMIGAHFLSFVEHGSRLSSELTLRFMDDICVFSDDRSEVLSDFISLQRMLGDKGLSVNPSKTKLGRVREIDVEERIDSLRERLLERRSLIVTGSGADFDPEEVGDDTLTDDESEYLMDLLKSPEIEEEDAELVLALMRDHSSDVLGNLEDFLRRFPNLSKSIFHFCSHIEDKSDLLNVVRSLMNSRPELTEFQLFWLGKIFEEHLIDEKGSAEIVHRLYDHPNATDISRAKLLEIKDRRFGLAELREEHLRTGHSGWLSWSSAVGTRVEKKKNRNHILGYFANGSPLNELIAQCVQRAT
jgi:Reverse transcriptase (RNA-dependent DNA polymerase)